MKVTVPKGRYVVAVSGGVDSMALLDALWQQPDVKLVVAHFDHGIRADSAEDRRLVKATAHKYGLPFVYHRGELGPDASEATARQARYDFLHQVRQAANAQAIITAHHQDDRLETAVINLLRGTGRRGLTALKSHDLVFRPLLSYDKQQIRDYAQSRQLEWHEDSTNQDEKYLRNYVRLKILTRFTPEQRSQLLAHLNAASLMDQELEQLLAVQLHIQPALDKLDRHWFTDLPHNVAKEVMASWLRAHGVSFDRKTIERLVVAAKTYQPHKQMQINNHYALKVEKDFLALGSLDR